ncbi:uncharacterized protein IL334_007605 [Kwoniella shivajii]|uniref:Protein kinase domain-containing protein n=1 Tax=Kwoniella shivajii TaxID=564305 RepID=A0ABZ1DAJ1_9TREE|nr:hypothetical protein IL334_007605 [Kwoniella shivajii]
MTNDHQPNTNPTVNQPGMLDDSYWSQFTSDFGDYELGPPIGFGASSTVYEAIFTPPSAHATEMKASSPLLSSDSRSNRKPNLLITLPNTSNEFLKEVICAIKVSTSHPDVESLSREIRLLSLCKHPNVLRILSTFTLPPDHVRICLITPNDPRRFIGRLGNRRRDEEDDADVDEADKGRLEEEEIKAVTKQVLEGLGYLHQNGFLHRDLKAGNLLIDEDGTILLADFGVGGDLNVPPSPIRSREKRLAVNELRFEKKGSDGFGPGSNVNTKFIGGEDLRKKKSFVGTPNWMAPEVIIGQRYDQKADIWSLGMTLLELAHGSVPGAKYKANKVLSHTVSDPPPTLDRSIGGYSRLMKDFIDSCLNKDSRARPSAKDLSDHTWLKGAKKKSFLAQSLLSDIPPLVQRQELRRVPTKSSLISHTSSWDFSTPNPSMPSSPMRTSLLIPSARSPSISSHLEYFNSIGRSHSRNSSFSLNPSNSMIGLPSSPRISLKQWAEESNPTLGLRSGSERGKSRSSSTTGMNRLKIGKSASFDIIQSSQAQSQKSTLKSTDDIIRTPKKIATSNNTGDDTEAEPHAPLKSATLGSMSPLVEGQLSHPSPEMDNLNSLGILSHKLHEKEEPQGLSESPEDIIDLNRQSKTSYGVLRGSASTEIDQKSETDSIRNSVPSENCAVQNDDVSHRADNAILTGNDKFTQHVITSNTASKSHSPLASKVPALNSQSTRNDRFISRMSSRNDTQNAEKEKDKKNWLSRRGSTRQDQLKSVMSINAKEGEKEVGGHAMGKTGSWTGVLGKVAGKIQKLQQYRITNTVDNGSDE